MPGRPGIDEDISMEQKTWQVYNFGKRNVFRLDLNESRKAFCQKVRGRSFHVDGQKTEKAWGTNSGESGVKNLEPESIRSRAESAGRCVKVKTVTEIRQSSAHDTFIAESVYLVLNSLLAWKPVEKLKQRCDVVSFKFFQYGELPEQHRSEYDEGFGQGKQADQKGENCSSQGVTE